MALIVPTGAETTLLTALTGAVSPVIHLYFNNVTISSSSVLSSFTEATFTGYSSYSLSGGSITLVSGKVQIAYAQTTFTASGGGSQSIYGYYVTDNANSTLYWAETFPSGPYTMGTNGDTLKVTAQLQLYSAN